MDKMKIEIWSDVMCPFCYIGKRRFEKALDNFENKEHIEVVWKSFQLNPQMITNPKLNAMEELAKRKGWTIDYTKEMQDYVSNMAKDEGLIFNYDKAVVANSYNAHRVLQYAKTQNKGDAMKELLLKAYFNEGKNTDDADTLIALGTSIGLPTEEVKKVIDDPNAFANEVNKDVYEAQQLGIHGVPYFVLDRKYGISGAQTEDVFSANLQKAYKEWSLQQSIRIKGLASG